MAHNPYNRYKQMQVTTTDPVRLVVMLYEGAIVAIRRAKEHIEQKDYAAKGKELMRAHDIVFELMSALDHQKGGEISQNLEQLYNYMIRRLLEANQTMDCAILDEVTGLLENLNEAWKSIAQQNKPDSDAAKTADSRPNLEEAL